MGKEKDRTNEGFKRVGAAVYAAALGTTLARSFGEFPLPLYLAHSLHLFEIALSIYFGVNQFRVRRHRNERRYYNNVLRKED